MLRKLTSLNADLHFFAAAYDFNQLIHAVYSPHRPLPAPQILTPAPPRPALWGRGAPARPVKKIASPSIPDPSQSTWVGGGSKSMTITKIWFMIWSELLALKPPGKLNKDFIDDGDEQISLYLHLTWLVICQKPYQDFWIESRNGGRNIVYKIKDRW